MKLNKHEVNYPTNEKELLALVDAVDKLKHYFHGAKVEVFTDNTCLQYLHNMANPSPRHFRWIHRLQEFDLAITHIPGKSNVVADILSRMHD